MKRLIISTIKREKIYKKNFKADSRTVIQNGDEKEEIEKFYESLAEILTLIYKDEIGGGGTYDTSEKSSSICQIF